MQETSDMKPVKMTESAVKRIAFLISQEPEGSMLRLSVNGGGCSGFQYDFCFDTEQRPDDVLVEQGDAKLLVDETSQPFLVNAVVNYVETLGAAHFAVENPQATASCGCGNSFSV